MGISVTGRVQDYNQPHGGFINPKELTRTLYDDGWVLAEENIHPSLVGTVVDYMTRVTLGVSVGEAFSLSILGMCAAGKVDMAEELLNRITGLNEESIHAACMLANYDQAARVNVRDVYPDTATINNIEIMVNRSMAFFDIAGEPVLTGFTFEPEGCTEKEFLTMADQCGGYTSTVSSGDGDYLMNNSLWDFKVSKNEPTSKHTLQLLMYWRMGIHSGRKEYQNIETIGIFNPRLNAAYAYKTSDVLQEIINVVDKEVIGYK